MENSPAGAAGQIRSLGGQLLILDIDLAALLGIDPDHLNALLDARRPALEREFAFPIGREEVRDLVPGVDDARVRECQQSRRAYTEHGVIIACAVLDNPRAIQLLIHLVRAFVARRESVELSRQSRPTPELH